MTLSLNKMMDYCTYCPKMCRFACPVSEIEKDESTSPWGKMGLAALLLNKKVHLSEAMAEFSYKCLNCMRCQVYCDHDVDVPTSLRELRKKAVKNYVAPQVVMDFERKFHRKNNPYEKDLSQVIKNTLPGKEYEHPGEVLFWPSCHTVHHQPEKLLAYTELFKKLGVKDVSIYVEDMQCCGQPLYDLGFDHEFEEVAEVLFYSLKSYSTLITDGSGCAHTLAKTYREKDFPLNAVHILEYMYPYFQNTNYRVAELEEQKIAYLDSFYLTRYFELDDIPRNIIEDLTGISLVEFDHSSWDTIAAGIGGGYELTSPEASEKLAANIIAEAKDKKVDLLLTSCSQTEALLKKIDPKLAVMDIFVFFNQAILE